MGLRITRMNTNKDQSIYFSFVLIRVIRGHVEHVENKQNEAKQNSPRK